jgi:hypothetical protein
MSDKTYLLLRVPDTQKAVIVLLAKLNIVFTMALCWPMELASTPPATKEGQYAQRKTVPINAKISGTVPIWGCVLGFPST